MNNNKISVGIDIGSLSTDALALYNNEIIAQTVTPTGANSSEAAELAYKGLNIFPQDVQHIVTTGYGRYSVEYSDKAVTEITCHALGARYLFPHARTVIDIGGQDSKVIILEEDGRVADFAMNDKCAAGCGRFLEVMARSLGVELNEMGDFSRRFKNDIIISGVCTVFAESEVIGLIAKGTDKADIIHGLHKLVAGRIYAMAARLKAKPPFVLSGGVAKNIGVGDALAEILGSEILVADSPQTVGALGAAIIASRL